VLLVIETALLVAGVEYFFSLRATRSRDVIAPHARLNHVWPANTGRLNQGEGDRDSENAQPFFQYFNAQSWLEEYDVSLTKPTDTFRIFYVGDSFVEGATPMDRNLPSLVERKLSERFATSGTAFEVINTGTRSYSPILYYILIRYYLAEYDPDLIVLNIDMTDDFDDFKYRQTLVTDENGDPWAAPRRDIFGAVYLDTERGPIALGWREKLHLWLYMNSYTYNWLIARNTTPEVSPLIDSAAEVGVGYSRWQWVEREWEGQTAENAMYTLRMIGRIARYCAANDIGLLLTAVPHFRQFTDVDGERAWSLRPHREIARVAAEQGVPYFDAHAALAPKIAGTEQTEYYARGDMHFNLRGYRLWAKAHFEALIDPTLGLLPVEVLASRP
jgi:hypothetical protein